MRSGVRIFLFLCAVLLIVAFGVFRLVSIIFGVGSFPAGCARCGFLCVVVPGWFGLFWFGLFSAWVLVFELGGS